MCVGLFVCLLQTIKDAFDAIRTLAINVNAYGVVTSEEQARSIIKTHADMVIAPLLLLLRLLLILLLPLLRLLLFLMRVNDGTKF